MCQSRVRSLVAFVVLSVCTAYLPAQGTCGRLEFHVTQTVSDKPFTGRVYLMLSKSPLKELPSRPSWFKPDLFFAKDVKDWQPGAKLILGEEMLGFPVSLGKLSKGSYFVQAVVDFDKSDQHVIAAEGNAYSKPVRFQLDPAKPAKIELVADQVYPPRQFQETERVKLVDIESKLLSAFHGRPIRMRAAVILPKSFVSNPDKKYAVIYEIPGFSGTHQAAHAAAERNGTDVASVEMLYVVLDPTCRLGHHVFVDSENNGPCGRALVEELIPFIEKTYRGLGEARGRFITGHSSGGWSSLWLQITYPDFFGGVWSTAPDPVDFRDFQKVNIYEQGTNIFTDAAGKPRPLARRGGQVLLYYKPFSDMEVVMGRSGQLFSFEAVFSPKADDGKPRPLWNRQTGAIDPVTAKSWERYDIRLVMERNWDALAPKLNGKVHVYMGSQDTFYLDGATILLKESLAKLGSDAMVAIFPGRDHGTLLDRGLRERIAREMAAQFLNHKTQTTNHKQIEKAKPK